MKCTACGTEFGDDQGACPSCGAPATTTRPCPVCGTLLTADDESCPICDARRAAGLTIVEPAVASRRPRRRLRIAVPPRVVRVALLSVAMLAFLGVLAVVPYAILSREDGGVAAPPTPRASSDATQPAASGPASPVPTGAQPPGVAALPTLPSRPTPTWANLAPAPPLPPIPLSMQSLGGPWKGFATVRRVALIDASPTEISAFQPQLRGMRFEPRPLVLEFDARSSESGLLKVTPVKPEGLGELAPPDRTVTILELAEVTVPYDSRDGVVSFQVDLRTRFEGEAGLMDGRIILQGGWQRKVPLRPTDPSGPSQLWEGTWTVARGPDLVPGATLAPSS